MKARPGSGRPRGVVQPGNWMQEGRLGFRGEPLDCPGAQAASTAAPPSQVCGSPECVCRDQSRHGHRARKKHRGRGSVRLRPAAEGGNRPLPGGQTFQRLRLPWARLRRVPGRGQVAPAKAPAGHPLLVTPMMRALPRHCAHTPPAPGTSGHVWWGTWRCWRQAGSQPQGCLPSSSTRDEGPSAHSPGSWRPRLGTWS